MLQRLVDNARKPEGLGGTVVIWLMNSLHSSGSKWGLSQLTIDADDTILDIGCGGGMNIARMLEMAPQGKVFGVDYSTLSVEKSRQLNQKAIALNRSEVLQGSVSQLPYSDCTFDVVTAFETVYFWPDFLSDLKEVLRVLKVGGTLLIYNEATTLDDKEAPYKEWMNRMNMKMYSPRNFEEAMTEVGFTDIQVILSTNSRAICVLAHK